MTNGIVPVPAVITALLAIAVFQLLAPNEVKLMLAALGVINAAVPLWKYTLQKRKISLHGPWVLVHPQAARAPK